MFVSFVLAKIRLFVSYRRMVRELSALTDRELDDIGLARGQIGPAILNGRR